MDNCPGSFLLPKVFSRLVLLDDSEHMPVSSIMMGQLLQENFSFWHKGVVRLSG